MRSEVMLSHGPSVLSSTALTQVVHFGDDSIAAEFYSQYLQGPFCVFLVVYKHSFLPFLLFAAAFLLSSDIVKYFNIFPMPPLASFFPFLWCYFNCLLCLISMLIYRKNKRLVNILMYINNEDKNWSWQFNKRYINYLLWRSSSKVISFT